ncbi:CotH kinase family protein [Oceaniferula marina]|nr:CotH kinase family protein [Oceaniferula marina]
MCCLGLNCAWAQVADHPLISEVMADNDTTLADADGDFSDWLEIYNPTELAFDLTGYYLTDDAEELTKWSFPSVSLAAGGRLLVYASDKAPAQPGGELHTNFKLSKAGEYLALVSPDGVTVMHHFSPMFPAQTSDVSYGVIGGNPEYEQFMSIPTPGAANDQTLPAPGPIAFSEPSRTFFGELSVRLSSNEPEASIYYTTDGSDPSPANGLEYSGPITVNSTIRLRALALFAGQTGEMSGVSYIRLAADLATYQSDLPLMVIDNFGAGTIPAKSWSGNGSGIQQVARQPAVWATFDRDEVSGMAALTDAPQMMSLLGIRGRGAYSSSWSQKPYSAEAWNEVQDEKNVQVLGMPSHSDWVLYYPDTDSDKDPVMMFNTFMYDLSARMGRYAPRFRWVEAFVNEDGGDLTLADRRGVYAIIEKVSRSDQRLDFKKMSDDGTGGGFLVGINRMDSIPVGGFPAENGATSPQFFHTKGANRIAESTPNVGGGGDDIPRQSNGYLNFDNPGGYKINAAQRAAIEHWFSSFEDVLYDDARWLDPVDGYTRYLDADDFVDYFIYNNLSKNGDGMLISMFPWVGDDGKLSMGPSWDYNWGSYYRSGSATGTLWHRADRLWYGRLFADPDFEQRYIDRWFMHRDGPLSNAGIAQVIDEQAAEIGAERAQRQGFASESAWLNEQSTFKNWLTTRADWYDSQFVSRPVFVTAPGNVQAGDRVRFASPENGIIYYTVNGTDPRASGGGLSTGAIQYDGSSQLTPLVGSGAAVKVVVPTQSNPETGLGWTAIGYDDSHWISGAGGVGYDRQSTYLSEIQLDVRNQMDGVNASAYLRLVFNVDDPASYDVMRLKMKYDDGFVAYLNGNVMASANAPSDLDWNAGATTYINDSDALQFQSIDVSEHLQHLVSGENVLAIHGLNFNTNSSDFLMVPELEAGVVANDVGIPIPRSALLTARRYSGGGWSAPVDGYYFVNAVPAALGNLVVSEIHYRPEDASPEELAAGFSDRDDFEFVELMNVGAQSINLTGVRFVRVEGEGVEFDFSNVYPRVLGSGQRMLLVKNQAAFEFRYGTAVSAQTVGSFSGNLSNDGELLTLLADDGHTIQSIRYNDQHPWPTEADGGGESLILISPERIPDSSDFGNWRVSKSDGGNPGFSDALPYLGGDLIDYALESPLKCGVMDGGVVSVSYAETLGADDARVVLLSSTDMGSWEPLSSSIMEKSYVDGKVIWQGVLDSSQASGREKLFLRLSVTEK